MRLDELISFDTFISKIDIGRFTLKYNLDKLSKIELFKTLKFINFLYGYTFNNNESWCFIPKQYIDTLFRDKYNREYRVFDFIEVNESYRNGAIVKEDNYCKSYRLKLELLMDLSLNLLNDNASVITKDKKKISYYEYNGEYFKTKKEIKEAYNLSRRKLDTINLNSYVGLIMKELKHQDIELGYNHNVLTNITNGVPFDYSNKVDINLDRVKESILIIRNTYNDEYHINLLYELVRLYGVLNVSPYLNYIRGDFGRLFGVNNSTLYINPQAYSKRSRAILFEGQYEYDMNTAVASILTQQAKKFGIDTEFNEIIKYIKDKQHYRNKIIDRGFTEKQAKLYFTALFFGADVINTSSYSNLRKEFTHNELIDILQDNEIYDLVLDCMELFECLKEYVKLTYKVGDGYLIPNISNKLLSFSNEKEFKKNESKIIPFIYQGIEAFILDEIKDNYNCNLLLFDAFVSKEDYDVYDISAFIYKKTGYLTSWDKKKYENSYLDLKENVK